MEGENGPGFRSHSRLFPGLTAFGTVNIILIIIIYHNKTRTRPDTRQGQNKAGWKGEEYKQRKRTEQDRGKTRTQTRTIQDTNKNKAGWKGNEYREWIQGMNTDKEKNKTRSREWIQTKKTTKQDTGKNKNTHYYYFKPKKSRSMHSLVH